MRIQEAKFEYNTDSKVLTFSFAVLPPAAGFESSSFVLKNAALKIDGKKFYTELLEPLSIKNNEATTALVKFENVPALPEKLTVEAALEFQKNNRHNIELIVGLEAEKAGGGSEIESIYRVEDDHIRHKSKFYLWSSALMLLFLALFTACWELLNTGVLQQDKYWLLEKVLPYVAVAFLFFTGLKRETWSALRQSLATIADFFGAIEFYMAPTFTRFYKKLWGFLFIATGFVILLAIGLYHFPVSFDYPKNSQFGAFVQDGVHYLKADREKVKKIYIRDLINKRLEISFNQEKKQKIPKDSFVSLGAYSMQQFSLGGIKPHIPPLTITDAFKSHFNVTGLSDSKVDILNLFADRKKEEWKDVICTCIELGGRFEYQGAREITCKDGEVSAREVSDKQDLTEADFIQARQESRGQFLVPSALYIEIFGNKLNEKSYKLSTAHETVFSYTSKMYDQALNDIDDAPDYFNTILACTDFLKGHQRKNGLANFLSADAVNTLCEKAEAFNNLNLTTYLRRNQYRMLLNLYGQILELDASEVKDYPQIKTSVLNTFKKLALTQASNGQYQSLEKVIHSLATECKAEQIRLPENIVLALYDIIANVCGKNLGASLEEGRPKIRLIREYFYFLDEIASTGTFNNQEIDGYRNKFNSYLENQNQVIGYNWRDGWSPLSLLFGLMQNDTYQIDITESQGRMFATETLNDMSARTLLDVFRPETPESVRKILVAELEKKTNDLKLTEELKRPVEVLLKEANIRIWKDLANVKPNRLRRILADTEYRQLDPSGWPKAAQKATNELARHRQELN